MNYPSFPSIERLENIYCIITEKVDGTNGLIEVEEVWPVGESKKLRVRFGSRNRYLSICDDNYGFMNYYRSYEDKIIKSITNMQEANDLVSPTKEFTFPIRIYGEWFGVGIQRGYTLKDRYFMPFSDYYAEQLSNYVPNIILPYELYKGKFSLDVMNELMNDLKTNGSKLVEGYNNPEGIVIYFPAYNFRLKNAFPEQEKKKTEHDHKPNKEDHGTCEACGKRLYMDRKTGVPQCNNFHCSKREEQ